MRDTILVSGGAGFIGSNFILGWVREKRSPVVNLDLLTYAGNPANLASVANLASAEGVPLYRLEVGDIRDARRVAGLLREVQPRAILHFAAESHVDRSIAFPELFIRTNVLGTQILLDEARRYWAGLGAAEKAAFRFLHVSTDEVYGPLGTGDQPFTEGAAYAPANPYAASKAAADHLVRAYYRTWKLPVLITNSSNNFGPYQFPEKLVPLITLNALEGQPLPVYGDGLQSRDWLFVEEHCAALRGVLENGRVGETYHIGGQSERRNFDVVRAICELLDEMSPDPAIGPRRRLITFVEDRPGHDRRYALDATKMARELGWRPSQDFDGGLRQTVRWYLDHPEWLEGVRTGAYLDWIRLNYTERGAS